MASQGPNNRSKFYFDGAIVPPIKRCITFQECLLDKNSEKTNFEPGAPPGGIAAGITN